MSLLRYTLIAFTLLSISTQAAEAPEPAATYPAETKTITSKVLQEDREVIIQLPVNYHEYTDRHYPVLYLLDGDTNVSLIHSLLGRRAKSGEAPEFIIVGIKNTDRLRDLAPTVNHDPRGPVGKGGGGDKFLNYLEHELMPYINKQYRTHDYKVLSGHSLGGLLVLHALQSRPNLFQAHLAYSPAVWWGDRTTAKNVKAFMKNTKQFNNFLYMNIGSEGGEMREVYDDLQQTISQNTPDGLRFHVDAFNDITHDLTSSAGAFNAWHHLLWPRRMPKEAFKNDVASVKAYHDQVSQQYGRTIKPSQWTIDGFGYRLMKDGNLTAAIEIFGFNTKEFPDSPYSWASLSEAQEKHGDHTNALISTNKALSLAKEGDYGYEQLIERQKRLSTNR